MSKLKCKKGDLVSFNHIPRPRDSNNFVPGTMVWIMDYGLKNGDLGLVVELGSIRPMIFWFKNGEKHWMDECDVKIVKSTQNIK